MKKLKGGNNSHFHMTILRIVVIVLISLMITSCFRTELMKMPSYQLLIELSDFPERWVQTVESDYQEHPSYARQVTRCFVIDENSIGARTCESVYRFSNSKTANRYYRNEEWMNFFRNPPDPNSWFIPQDFHFASPVADEWIFKCYIHHNEAIPELRNQIICQFLGLYQEYVVDFGIAMDEEFEKSMSYEKIESLIEVIDRKMVDENRK